MKLRLRPPHSLSGEIERALRVEIDRALGNFQGDLPIPEAIHEARKSCKRLRAALRLCRDDLGDHYDEWDQVFRVAAAGLSGMRDATVMAATLKTLRKDFDDEAAYDRFNEALLQRLDGHGHPEPSTDPVEEFERRIHDARARLAELPLERLTAEGLVNGFRRTYRQGRRRMHRASDSGSGEDFHRWRKAVRYHRVHCKLLRKISAKKRRRRIESLKELGELLGNIHDLVVLSAFVEANLPEGDGNEETAIFRKAARRRIRKLQGRAVDMGERLFHTKPKSFCASYLNGVESLQACENPEQSRTP